MATSKSNKQVEAFARRSAGEYPDRRIERVRAVGRENTRDYALYARSEPGPAVGVESELAHSTIMVVQEHKIGKRRRDLPACFGNEI